MIKVRSELTNELKKLGQIIAKLKAPRGVFLDLPKEEERKLGYLASGDRDFLTVNADLESRVKKAFTTAAIKTLKSGDVDAPWKAVGVEVAKAVGRRIAAGNGGDVPMPPLKRSTIEKKRRDGVARPTAIGYHTGALYRAIRKAAGGSGIKVSR